MKIQGYSLICFCSQMNLVLTLPSQILSSCSDYSMNPRILQVCKELVKISEATLCHTQCKY